MRIDPENLDVGYIFYECEYGVNLKMVAETKPEFENDQWHWAARDTDGKLIDYLITKGYEHYGPKLYSKPAYTN